VLAGSLTVMIVGQVIAGLGLGAAFSASLRLIFPLAAAHQRAGIVAGIYVVAYVAFGLPVVIAGQLAAPLLGVVARPPRPRGEPRRRSALKVVPLIQFIATFFHSVKRR
jgi:MFS family permease